MFIKKFFEFKQNTLDPVKSFKIKDDLNPKIWDNFKLKSSVRKDLLKIAKDFWNGTELEAEVKDIILTGSLANYNWSEKYSDYDLHIVIDFNDINKDNDLVKKLVDGLKTIWNLQHDIKIEGYEVEVYIQSDVEPHSSTGVFSLLKNKWSVKPKKVDFEPNEKEIEKKSKSIILQVDKIEEDFDELSYEQLKSKVKRVWNKIKKLRKSSLEEDGEFGIGNLVFKVLRRNGYIEKIMDLKKTGYEKQFESFKKINEELEDVDILKFIYDIEELNKKITRIMVKFGYETGPYVHATYDDTLPSGYMSMEVEMGESGHSDGWSKLWRIDWSDPERGFLVKSEASVGFSLKSYYSPYLEEGEDTLDFNEKEYDSLDDIFSDIKDIFSDWI